MCMSIACPRLWIKCIATQRPEEGAEVSDLALEMVLSSREITNKQYLLSAPCWQALEMKKIK